MAVMNRLAMASGMPRLKVRLLSVYSQPPKTAALMLALRPSEVR
ncbi:hypothetical protein VSS37_17710 [Candidatus Thiothrix sp. Deng01]|uniref:Uncharacterized protein n=1 Tax=Candidatus Thiothrix phosphatis TaxID=3112415 RepID=A0ABU6D1C6_9GAMM|nr:hypothetical protein [Candidatus Thiothrix sp. Deng01]MEB4592820.1 hypothetical protein [Candidatus Thiothrix sp. Deng01]